MKETPLLILKQPEKQEPAETLRMKVQAAAIFAISFNLANVGARGSHAGDPTLT